MMDDRRRRPLQLGNYKSDARASQIQSPNDGHVFTLDNLRRVPRPCRCAVAGGGPSVDVPACLRAVGLTTVAG